MSAKSPVRERILDAAVTLLRQSGVKRLAQPQVARAARVPQGHLTYYFPKKADMLMAVAARFVELLAQDVEPRGPSGRSAALRALVTRMVLDRERTRMLLGLMIEADEDPLLRAALSRGAGFVRDTLASGFGVTPNSREAHLALAMYWGLGLQQFLLGEERSDEETRGLVEQAVALIQSVSPPRPSSMPPPMPRTDPPPQGLASSGEGFERKGEGARGAGPPAPRERGVRHRADDLRGLRGGPRAVVSGGRRSVAPQATEVVGRVPHPPLAGGWGARPARPFSLPFEPLPRAL